MSSSKIKTTTKLPVAPLPSPQKQHAYAFIHKINFLAISKINVSTPFFLSAGRQFQSEKREREREREIFIKIQNCQIVKKNNTFIIIINFSILRERESRERDFRKKRKNVKIDRRDRKTHTERERERDFHKFQKLSNSTPCIIIIIIIC